MADIQLRFDKDMLVLSTPFSLTLNRLGFDESDRDYVVLCESESVEEAFKFESMAQTPVFVLPTENLTDARLMHSRFEGQGATMVQNCLEALDNFNPQHVIAAIGPTGLPLDESSKSSLRQSFEQYKRAVLLLSEQEIDGIYFSGFDNGYDAQCALMGARAVYDGPLFCSFVLDEEGRLSSGSHDLVSAAVLARESGADVVGVVSGSEPSRLLPWVDEVAAALDCPLLVELVVAHPDRRQAFPSKENPYPRTDHVVDAALQLRAHGVQFVRVQGNATPAYTGGLVAVLSGLDVHLPSAKGKGVSSSDVAEGFCAEGGVS
ncbi:MAG: homocysteine S-methyltransferase family protein [Coriobacteriia bacterium]|nr:homocysteine S-methyltransferase family protein [Coriobacteriia bacterium]